MKLSSPQGEFELTILDYEYSDSYQFLERNWLIISLKTSVDGRKYQRMAPLLSTWELELLHDWMCSINNDGPLSPKLSFIEPALTFRADSLGRGDYRFQIKLAQDTTSSDKTDQDNTCCLTVAADTGQVQSAIHDLKNQLSRFPVRN